MYNKDHLSAGSSTFPCLHLKMPVVCATFYSIRLRYNFSENMHTFERLFIAYVCVVVFFLKILIYLRYFFIAYVCVVFFFLKILIRLRYFFIAYVCATFSPKICINTFARLFIAYVCATFFRKYAYVCANFT